MDRERVVVPYRQLAGTRLTFVSRDRKLWRTATSDAMLVDDPNTHT